MKAIPAWEQFEVIFNSNAYDENSLEQFAIIIFKTKILNLKRSRD